MKIEFIVQNENGDYYVGYKHKVQRGIKGKTRSKVDELLIIGIPKSKFKDYCEKEGIIIYDQQMEYESNDNSTKKTR